MDLGEDVRRILETVCDAVVLADGQQKVSYMNRAALELTGMDPEDASGRDILDAFSLLDMNTGQPVTRDAGPDSNADGFISLPPLTVLAGADGREVPVSGGMYISRDPETGMTAVKALVLRDAGSMWMMDDLLRKGQRTDALRVLAGSIHGSLNDLLTVLLARLSSIGREQGNRSSVLRLARESRKTVDRIGSMFATLVMDEDGHDERAEVSFVPRVLGNCIDIFSSAYSETSLEVAYPDRTGYALIRSELLEQVLLNLMMNAGEAAGRGGVVRVSACRLDLKRDLSPLSKGRYVMLSVADNGTGIPDETLSKILQPFFSTKGGRFGMGLPAVYSILGIYGGRITVRTGREAGSVFTVYLPAAAGLEMETASDAFPAVDIQEMGREDAETAGDILEAMGFDQASKDEGDGKGARIVLAGRERSLDGRSFETDERTVLLPEDTVGIETVVPSVCHSLWRRVHLRPDIDRHES